MTRRLTLRLPNDLHQRLREEARRQQQSLNAVIISTLEAATTQPPCVQVQRSREEELRIVKAALGDLVVDTSGWLQLLPPGVTPLDPETLRERMPIMYPPLSQAIIQEREESRY